MALRTLIAIGSTESRCALAIPRFVAGSVAVTCCRRFAGLAVRIAVMVGCAFFAGFSTEAICTFAVPACLLDSVTIADLFIVLAPSSLISGIAYAVSRIAAAPVAATRCRRLAEGACRIAIIIDRTLIAARSGEAICTLAAPRRATASVAAACRQGIAERADRVAVVVRLALIAVLSIVSLCAGANSRATDSVFTARPLDAGST